MPNFIEVNLEDDLVGNVLTEEDLARTEPDQPVSFEWQALELIREIYAAGVRSYLRAIGVSDELLAELGAASSQFERDSLVGAVELGPADPPRAQFEGVFLLGIALGSQVWTDDPALAERISSPSLDPSITGTTRARIVHSEVNSRLHVGAVPADGIPCENEDPGFFEGFSYDDARAEIEAIGGGEVIWQRPVVITPPGFSPTGLLNIARVILSPAESGFGFVDEKDGVSECEAAITILTREWLAAGTWLGIWLRARELELGGDDGRHEMAASVPREEAKGSSGRGISCLLCGWEYGQGMTPVLARARRERERVMLPQNPEPNSDEDALALADYFLQRLEVQISIYSCQATGDFTWWPVYSFLEKGDLVLVRLAPFPRLSREQLDAWFPGYSLAKIIMKNGATLLPEGQPPLLGLDRTEVGPEQNQAAERLWTEVDYLQWLIPSEPREGVANVGLDGLGVVTSDAVWEDGSWRATIGMIRPFVRSVEFGDLPSRDGTNLPLFPQERRDDQGFELGALTMLANVQFLPSRTRVDDREIPSILEIASRESGTGLPWSGGKGSPNKYGLREPSHSLASDFERIKLVGENLRRGRQIKEMADISPWPVDGTWLREGVDSMFPGRLRLEGRPDLSSYPYWVLARDQNGRIEWLRELSGESPSLLGEEGRKFKGAHPAIGARKVIESLRGLTGEWSGRGFGKPDAILVALPDDSGSLPFDEALAALSDSGEVTSQWGEAQLSTEPALALDGTSPRGSKESVNWTIDPEGLWQRAGSIYLFESDGRPDDSVKLFTLKTSTPLCVIDIEAVSAQISRSMAAGGPG